MNDSHPPSPAPTEKDLFIAALDLEDPKERETFLVQQCRGDKALLKRVKELLEVSGDTGHFLDAEKFPAAEEELSALAEDIEKESRFIANLGDTIIRLGDYELIEEVGRGATGVVYRARQVSLNREVAVKVILGSTWMTAAGRQRFRMEAEAAANLQHQHIVPVHEIGHIDGHDFYSMTYFPGGTLGDHLKELRQDRRAMVRLVAKVAHTMQEAHNRGIFHRDLKPDNILLGDQQEPFISDFGLAYDLRQSNGLTLTGQILGTPQYMAPEQAMESGYTTSAQTDIYSMGAMLFELLTGRPVIEASSFMTALRLLVEAPPPRLRSVDATIDRDLETIVAKCLEKNPADRYVSAGRLADDLEAWLDHRPISIVAQTSAQRALRWIKRKPVHAALLGSLLLLFGSFGVGGPLVALRQAALRENAESAQAEAVAAAEFAQKQAQANRRLAYASNMRLITMAAHLGTTPTLATQSMLNALRPSPAEDDFRGWEWFYAYGDLHLPPIEFSRQGPVNSLNFSPFGESFLLSNPTGTIMFDSLNRVSARRFMDGEEHTYSGWSPDDGTIVTLGKSGRVNLWAPKTAELLAALPEPARSVSWGPAGQRLAVLGADGTIGIWTNENTPRQWGELIPPPAELEQIAWSPNGRYIAGVGQSHDVFVWDIESPGSPLEIYQGHNTNLCELAWMHDSSWLATGAVDGALRIWGVPGGRRIASSGMNGYWDGPITNLVWDPDGLRLLHTITGQEALMLLDFTLNLNDDFQDFGGTISAAAWSAETHSVVGGNTDGDIIILRQGLPAASRVLWEGEEPLTAVRWNADGMEMAVRSESGKFMSLISADGQELRSTELESVSLEPWAWSSDGQAVAVVSLNESGHLLRIIDLEDGEHMQRIELGSINPAEMIWSGEKEIILSERNGGIFRIARGSEPTVQRLWNPAGESEDAWAKISVSPDGAFVLASAGSGQLWLVSTVTGEVILQSPGSGASRPSTITHAWHPAGQYFAVSRGEGQISLWSVAGQDQVEEFQRLRGTADVLAWHPHGNRLASGGGESGTIVIWDWANGEPVLELHGHGDPVTGLAWDLGGRRLSSVSRDGTLMVWDATAGVMLSREGMER